MKTTADALDAGLLQYSDGARDRHRRVRRDARTSGSTSGTVLPIVDAERPGAGADRASAAGSALRLGDVADVAEGHQPLIGDAVINDGPGLLLIVEKSPGATRSRSPAASRRRSTSCSPGLPGIEIDPTIFRPATFIEHRDRQPHAGAARSAACS